MADSPAYGSLQFSEQVAFFRRKLGNQLPTNAWTDIWNEAHDHAFVVAGANRADLLSDLAGAVDKAISKGATLEEFRRDFDGIVARHGWDYKGGRNWRTRVIYETNLRTSYAAGRWEQLQSVKKTRPYWIYEHSDAVQHPRPLHKAWDGLVLHADDPWWRTHYPPNGWGCQCTVHALNARDLARLGKSGPDTAPPLDMQTVQVGQNGPSPRTVQVPAGIDPGFGYAPGRDIWLREQATRAVQADGAQAAAQWEPILRTRAADLGLPARLTPAPAPAPLAAPPAGVDGIAALLRTVLGAERTVASVQGQPFAVDAAALAPALDPADAPYLPWLPDLLANAAEVWLQLERDASTGIYRLRTRAMGAYQPDSGTPRLAMAIQQDGALVDWQTHPLAAADLYRMGLHWTEGR
jgi:hypothetical protein